ncbi:MAG TPA: acetyl/propionyl/methylcrotonyl-CoA carboxylase subunit alpha [Methylomirabilota bacterium]|jgi:propionyl-CoA carboxylase alpha chain|nr:acetyl/propionyl/methylcrotonyl-CoA carboxylase subunit alpha [Methylomirabilota bacterium]
MAKRGLFSKILIANRGEIACRVMRTAKRLGIATVAVYSDADADARHVHEADEAVRIGPARSAESYLSIERILAAVKRTGAEAVHPGYGFLSENPRFCEALEGEGIAFIGPTPSAIAAMGDKIESKRLAAQAGVRTVPGFVGEIKDERHARKIAGEIGYPVMVKASAGGGGKGMRIAWSEAELKDALRSAASEARSSFGDDRLLIEKFIEEPRHIEIQVLADAHGTVLHLGERECSIQRRHQKVIEEAPSPFIDPKTRAAMGEQAVALARAVQYRSAGTVEFIVDRERNFYFLEMNTRLQVEHPVTELATGLDLVELMIRIAAGETLKLKQEQIELTGSAIEARVYAEDPARGFLPSTGRLVTYREPSGGNGSGIRIDSGVIEGGEITIHYDPMIAKLIAFGPDRVSAIQRLAHAIDGYAIRGLATNLPFLAAVARHPRFAEGRLSTGFIAEEFGTAFKSPAPSGAALRTLLALAAVARRRMAEREAGISGQLPGQGAPVPEEWIAALGPERHPLRVEAHGPGYRVRGEGWELEAATGWRPGAPVLEAQLSGKPVAARVEREGALLRLAQGGCSIEALVVPRHLAKALAHIPSKAAPDLSRFLLSPMPGLLVSLAVAEGEEVKAGQELAIVEAMKMENVLRAERDGRIARLHASTGASLAVDQAILEFE